MVEHSCIVLNAALVDLGGLVIVCDRVNSVADSVIVVEDDHEAVVVFGLPYAVARDESKWLFL